MTTAQRDAPSGVNSHVDLAPPLGGARSLFVRLNFTQKIDSINFGLRVSYSGYYASFPNLRRGFDSLYPLQKKFTDIFLLSFHVVNNLGFDDDNIK